jgi:hypothetical protein
MAALVLVAGWVGVLWWMRGAIPAWAYWCSAAPDLLVSTVAAIAGLVLGRQLRRLRREGLSAVGTVTGRTHGPGGEERAGNWEYQVRWVDAAGQEVTARRRIWDRDFPMRVAMGDPVVIRYLPDSLAPDWPHEGWEFVDCPETGAPCWLFALLFGAFGVTMLLGALAVGP